MGTKSVSTLRLQEAAPRTVSTDGAALFVEFVERCDVMRSGTRDPRGALQQMEQRRAAHGHGLAGES